MLKQNKLVETRVYEIEDDHFVEISLVGSGNNLSVYEVWVWSGSSELKMFCFSYIKTSALDWSECEKRVEKEIGTFIQYFDRNYDF